MAADVTACVEVGASSVQTVLLGPGTRVDVLAGAQDPGAGSPLLIAVPGLIEGTRVVAASNVGWYDVDPAEALGLRAPADFVCNDAEAAAVGESALRPGAPDLVFVGLGTGVGGAVVHDGSVVANLFAHLPGFSDRTCTCGRTGCLETVAGGWALPPRLSDADLPAIARALGDAVDREPLATPRLVVLAGGMSRTYPALLPLVQAALPRRTVEPSLARHAKSAAAWGLRHLWQQSAAAPAAGR